ncbi:MAG: peptide chain release factor N(5)-glutamine methyltransferase [Bacilli bacterium]|jgi:release factor glutamine methyltransferase
MTLAQAYHQSLRQADVEPQAVKTLLCHIQKLKGNGELFLHWDEELSSQAEYDRLLTRLIEGEPVQYILNEAYFHELPFYVDEAVLIPRPETEQLVEIASAELSRRSRASVVDLGTGSGCIAVALKKKFPKAEVWATDISENALEIAKRNAKRHQTAITFMQGDWIQPLIRMNLAVDLIVSNPPYIANAATVAQDVLEYEPHLALFAKNGISNHLEILANARHVLRPGGLILLEIDADQVNQLALIARSLYESDKIEFIKDLQGKPRFIKIELQP